jgi:soluble lytic murein transglycosylase-like protein
MRTMLLILTIFLVGPAFGESKTQIASQIATVASASGLDPDIAVAIATVESGLNPNAVGGLGEIGLFQLRPEYHRVIKHNGNHNILVGVAYLVELKTKWAGKYGDAWFVLYNYGPHNVPKHPRQTVYYSRVMKELGRLKAARYLASI